jgi:hypothetical protein
MPLTSSPGLLTDRSVLPAWLDDDPYMLPAVVICVAGLMSAALGLQFLPETRHHVARAEAWLSGCWPVLTQWPTRTRSRLTF